MKSGDTLVVYRTSRIARNYTRGWNFVKLLKAKKINIVSVDEQIDSNENLRELQIKLKTAENFSNELSDRINKINKHLKRMGWHFGRVPFGYESYFAPNGIRKLRQNDKEQEIIKRICRMRNKKNTYVKISKELNKKKKLFRKKYWNAIMVGAVYRKNKNDFI
jgi:DNA invertase Pin-like site-specific DNA recombinase